MGYNTQEFIKPKKDKKDDFVDKNFLLVSLEGSKAKKIAEVINNDTARKILEHLAKKDFSESELSLELGIPISTIHYNLKQLQEANLVVVEEFHYSKKGKEINHYSLANKYIIIAPKYENTKFLEALKKVIPVAVITAVVGAAMTIINFLTSVSNTALSKAADQGAVAPRLMTVAPNAAGIAASNATEAVQQAVQTVASQTAGVAASNATQAAQPIVQSAASQAANIAPPVVSQAVDTVATNAHALARPLMQTNFIALFLIGALAIIIIYFLYELVKKN